MKIMNDSVVSKDLFDSTVKTLSAKIEKLQLVQTGLVIAVTVVAIASTLIIVFR